MQKSMNELFLNRQEGLPLDSVGKIGKPSPHGEGGMPLAGQGKPGFKKIFTTILLSRFNKMIAGEGELAGKTGLDNLGKSSLEDGKAKEDGIVQIFCQLYQTDPQFRNMLAAGKGSQRMDGLMEKLESGVRKTTGSSSGLSAENDALLGLGGFNSKDLHLMVELIKFYDSNNETSGDFSKSQLNMPWTDKPSGKASLLKNKSAEPTGESHLERPLASARQNVEQGPVESQKEPNKAEGANLFALDDSAIEDGFEGALSNTDASEKRPGFNLELEILPESSNRDANAALFLESEALLAIKSPENKINNPNSLGAGITSLREVALAAGIDADSALAEKGTESKSISIGQTVSTDTPLSSFAPLNSQNGTESLFRPEAPASAREPNPLHKMVAEQVSTRFETFMEDGQSKLVIKLHPEHLGRVTMRVVLEGDQLTSRIAVESDVARQALEANVGQLKEALGTQGINVKNVEIYVVGEALDMGFNRGHNQKRDQETDSKKHGLSKLEAEEALYGLTETQSDQVSDVHSVVNSNRVDTMI